MPATPNDAFTDFADARQHAPATAGTQAGSAVGERLETWAVGQPTHNPARPGRPPGDSFYPQVPHPNPPKTEEMNHTHHWSMSPTDVLAGPDSPGPTWRTLPCLKSMS